MAVNALSERSNRRLECFEGSASGAYPITGNATHNTFAWPMPADLEQCGRFFDGDGSLGPLVKFDFDFGDHPRPVVAGTQNNPLPENPEKSKIFALGAEVIY